MNAILTPEVIREVTRQRVRDALGPRMITLYDQFGRPVQVPSTQSKIGETITVRRPQRAGTPA